MAVRFIPDRRLPDKALDLLDEGCAEASLSGEPRVVSRMIAEVVAQRTGIPVRKLSEEERERMQNIEHALTERVIGQEDAVQKLAPHGQAVPGRPARIRASRGVCSSSSERAVSARPSSPARWRTSSSPKAMR